MTVALAQSVRAVGFCPSPVLTSPLAHHTPFSWRETAAGHWTGVMGGRVWTLTQTDDTLWYHAYTSRGSSGGRVDGQKRKAGASLRGSTGSVKRSRGVAEVKEEEEEPAAVTPERDRKEEEEMLRDYFQLKVKLRDLYQEWGAADSHFKHIANVFTGGFVFVSDTAVFMLYPWFVCVTLLSEVFIYISPRGVCMLRQLC